MKFTYQIKVKHNKTRTTIIKQIFKNGGWQDIDRTWLTVDQVYETRWDCISATAGGCAA